MESSTKIALALVGALVVALVGTWLLWNVEREVVIAAESADRQEKLERVLAENGVAFRRDELNRVTVVQEDLQFARDLANESALLMPERDGFELFQEEDYGSTDFVQRVNYQRALQAELERSIIGLNGVKDARVHVQRPARSTFFRRKNDSRASVILDLEPGTTLPMVTQSVGELMVGAVDGLGRENVKIISGRGLVAPSQSATGGASHSLGVEARLSTAVGDLLEPLFDRTRIGVSITVEVDRASRNLKRQNVPVALAEDAGSQGPAGAVARQETISEEVTTPPGAIRRIGVGVMLPRTVAAAEMSQIEELLTSGLGLSKTRGDTLVIMAFPGEPAATNEVDKVVEVVETQPVALQMPIPTIIASQPYLSQGQWQILLLVIALALVILMIVRNLLIRRRRDKLVTEIASWLQEPSRE